jgi:hypothetical protein
MYHFTTLPAWSAMTGRAQTETRLPSIRRAGERSFRPVALQIRAGRHGRADTGPCVWCRPLWEQWNTEEGWDGPSFVLPAFRARCGVCPMHVAVYTVPRRRRREEKELPKPMLPHKTGIHGNHAGPVTVIRPSRIAFARRGADRREDRRARS